MGTTANLLASGPGWHVNDVVCTAGPCDRPFEEQHETVCIAAVLEGTFQYRTRSGSAVLAPGALLLGDHGTCFECGHEHAVGDRCLSFHFSPAYLEEVAADVPGTRRIAFGAAHLPPLPALMSLLAAAEAARDERNAAAFEELALRFAGAVTATLADSAPHAWAPSRHDARRITAALRQIEARAHSPLTLAALARAAAMSPYHFLRTFRQLAGMTPHQYVLRTRMHRAAVRLLESTEPVAAIALDAGFNDLSTFNRRFRRLMDMSPRAYRGGRRIG
jgi:AraC family transcriptional regulator